jgi:hypothetical protein
MASRRASAAHLTSLPWLKRNEQRLRAGRCAQVRVRQPSVLAHVALYAAAMGMLVWVGRLWAPRPLCMKALIGSEPQPLHRFST